MVWRSFIRPSHRFNRYTDRNRYQPSERCLVSVLPNRMCRRTQRVGTSLYLPPDKSSFMTMMATKRRSHIFARSRVTELPLTDQDLDGSFLDERPTPGVKAG
jgi:hypothetical protein